MMFDPIIAAKVTETARHLTMTVWKTRQVNISYGRSSGKSIFYQSYYDNFFFKKQYRKKYWPYQFTIDYLTIDRREVERWCWNRFKGRYWNSNYAQYVFKREKDAVMFALKWL